MITLYTKPMCPYCDMAKNYLDKNEFEYETINVMENDEARTFIMNEGHRTMPQIYHNGKLLVAGGGQALVRMPPNKVRELIGEVVDVSDFKL